MIPPLLFPPLPAGFGRAALIGGLVLALCAASATAGYFYRGIRAEVQTSAINLAGATQTTAARAETARGKEINKELSDEYQDARQRLLARPVLPATAPRLRIAACDRAGGVPGDAGARPEPDGDTAERGPGAGGGSPSEQAGEDFAQRCRADAQQVMWLEDYIERVCQRRRTPVGEE
jgi:hypothetical protein